ncbi:hypothetical protein [uncultured Enorma sp.]|uniref:hypothetical protein n=1 Tax=uncultured Enorma sp. TaxID=1714346 RepID=UPI0025988B36|nr:hypothetical protein [uncultured Enorma sp.]
MRPEVIVFLIFLLVYFVATTLLRRYYEVKVEMLYATGLFDDCFDTLNKLLPRILFPTYKQYQWRFMVHDARGERELATRMIELMLRMRSSKKRLAQTVALAFNYYVSIEDKKRAKELLQQAKGLCDESVVKDMQLTYDIMLGNRHDCIERMEELVDTAAPEARAKLYMLIAKQYRNAGNREKARYYEGLLKQFIAENSMPRPKGAQAEGKPGEPSETADGK